MSEPFIGEIVMFGGNFAPRGYALCDGQTLQISQNEALFSLLGTTYGGDGRQTFGLPDLRGRLALHQGQGPGLSNRPMGQEQGDETVGLTINQMPNHSHTMNAESAVGTADDAVGAVRARGRARSYRLNAPLNRTLSTETITLAGSGTAHSNVMPFTCVNYIIALVGIFPSRS